MTPGHLELRQECRTIEGAPMVDTAVAIDNKDVLGAEHPLDFLWLELTNQCNLKCVHCYSESSPQSIERNLLDENQYKRLLADAYGLNCRRVQFIGGEPTLNQNLPCLIGYADELGYEFIEVYTNLVNLSEALLATFVRHRVAVATSVYADVPEIHDVITQMPGSHKRTLTNVSRLLSGGVPVRVGVIAMEENAGALDGTFELLRDLGVTNIGFDRVRKFGRAQRTNDGSMENLCGNCANHILAVGPDGIVAPCIMSKQWSVGSVLTASLKQIAVSESLLQTRRRIADATARNFGPNPCQPDRSCMPNCTPSYNCTPCSPNASQPCQPNRWCDPSKR
jgi:sulfatase maturation enzyme AslB (radical SAM superfamily)